MGKIILPRLAADIYGPGSDLSTLCGLPIGANKHNYYHVVVSGICVFNILELTVSPVPAYSAEDPNSQLSSVSWLLNQADNFKNMHIPLPWQTTAATLSTPPHPSFPTPVAFGDPFNVEGWKSRRPGWVVVVPQVCCNPANKCVYYFVFTFANFMSIWTAVQ